MQERIRILKTWAQLIRDHADDLAMIMTMENGKPLTDSKFEIPFGANFVDSLSEEALRVCGDFCGDVGRERQLFTVKQPIGVVGMITPWNFPNSMITRKAAGALAVGCTMVIKPADLTPLSATALAELAERAGFPPGVFNVITTLKAAEVGQVLCKSPDVRAMSFTGSSRIGKLIMQQCAETVKKCSLELGGNAPFIVFEDADWQSALNQLVDAKTRCAGQACISPNRVFVHEKLYDQFATKAAEAMSAITVGAGCDASCPKMGPVICNSAVDKIDELVKDAVAKGAKTVTGGHKLTDRSGFFYAPTVLMNVNRKMRIFSEEIFGPVISLVKFTSEEEVIEAANATQAGLAAYAYTRDAGRQWRMLGQLEYGMVGVNEYWIVHEQLPFGGVKESGLGREGTKYGLEDFLEVKSVVLRN